MLYKIRIIQDPSEKISRIVQKPCTLKMLFPDYFLYLKRLRNQKIDFLKQWRISVIIIFREFDRKLKIWKRQIFCAQLEYNSWKLHHIYICSMLKILDGEQKSGTVKQATNFINGQQFNYCFVFNQTVKSRRTKNIAHYF